VIIFELIFNHNFLDNDCLPCLPGLPSVWVGVLLFTLIQVVGVSIIAMIIPRLYARNWDCILLGSDQEDRD
jgi:hypothetical protein